MTKSNNAETYFDVYIPSLVGAVLNLLLFILSITYKNEMYLTEFVVAYCVIVLVHIVGMRAVSSNFSSVNISNAFYCVLCGVGLILVFATLLVTTSEYYLKSKHRGYFVPTKEKEEEYMSRILSGKIEPFRMQEDE